LEGNVISNPGGKNMSNWERNRKILAEKGLLGGHEKSMGEEDPQPREICPSAEVMRQRFFGALSSADVEFPYWYTRTWNQWEGEVPVVRRARALKAAFSHLSPNVIPGEKIVMQKTRHMRGSFPMPWLSESFFLAKEDELYQQAAACGSASADELSQFGSGGGNVTQSFGDVVSIAGKFGMHKQEIPALIRLAHAWQGQSVEDISRRYEKMSPHFERKENLMKSLVCMFDSGFTLPLGREVIDYYLPLSLGFEGIKRKAREKMDEVFGQASGDGIRGMDRFYFYHASVLVVEGIQKWILNHRDQCLALAQDPKISDAQHYREIAERLDWIACNPPRDFREALQLSYIVHIASLNEDAISGMSIGRLGQVLWPWFEQDIASGAICEDEVLELLQQYRVKITCIDCFASAGVVGGVLSGNTFNNLTLGGLKKDGSSAVNRLEWLIVEAGIRCPTPQPTLSVLYDERLEEGFLRKAIECVKTGAGYPAWMNNRVGMDFLLEQYGPEGMNREDVRAIAIGGCLETSPCIWHAYERNGKRYDIPGGAGQPTSVGVHFLALPKLLELALNDGRDLRTGLQVFPAHGKKATSYRELWQAFCELAEQAMQVLTRANNLQHDIWRKNNPAVFNSLLKPDCLETGLHVGLMGYRFNATFNVESCGTANLVNALASLRQNVFESQQFTLAEMIQALNANFGFVPGSLFERQPGGERFDREYAACLAAPKYGNDDPLVDSILVDYEQWFARATRQCESLYGKKMYPCQISVSTHGPQGAATLASADGRLSGVTYADGSMSAFPGTDRNGPYALFESATGWDHASSQNSQMNIKMHPQAVAGEEGTRKLLALTRAYMRKGGFHIQYNVVDSNVLKRAQEHPEAYRDLMVRVAGFTQYWVEIGKPIQDEVIARTEYRRF